MSVCLCLSVCVCARARVRAGVCMTTFRERQKNGIIYTEVLVVKPPSVSLNKNKQTNKQTNKQQQQTNETKAKKHTVQLALSAAVWNRVTRTEPLQPALGTEAKRQLIQLTMRAQLHLHLQTAPRALSFFFFFICCFTSTETNKDY